MTDMIFSLQITPEQYQAYYQGTAKNIVVNTEDGRRLQFPANAMQQFVSHDGIKGRFRIRFDSHNKLVDVVRL